MASLDTGRYTITNVKYLNLAVLPDANDESDIVARADENNAGEKVYRFLLRVPVRKHDLPHYSVEHYTAQQQKISD